MSDWQVQDAKARFSELLNLTLKDGPQVVTRRGVAAAVLVPIDEWRRLQDSSRPSLKALLLGSPLCYNGCRMSNEFEPRLDILPAPQRRLWEEREVGYSPWPQGAAGRAESSSPTRKPPIAPSGPDIHSLRKRWR